MIAKTFLRLERDFDKHVTYCRDEPLAQEFLAERSEVRNYFKVGAKLIQSGDSLFIRAQHFVDSNGNFVANDSVRHLRENCERILRKLKAPNLESIRNVAPLILNGQPFGSKSSSPMSTSNEQMTWNIFYCFASRMNGMFCYYFRF